MKITPLHYAAFCRGGKGGNPAGVAILERLPDPEIMQAVASETGFSETVFAARSQMADNAWEVRYFAPDGEVPFCGHATLALAYALGRETGQTEHALLSRGGQLRCISAEPNCEIFAPAYSGSPVTRSDLENLTDIFGLAQHKPGFLPPYVVAAGACHVAIEVGDRPTLSAMQYDFNRAQVLMRMNGWITIALFWRETPTKVYIRNAFAFGGVVEDPATGAAAAAVAGFLQSYDPELYRDAAIEFLQGDDIGIPCTLWVEPSSTPGGGQRISGSVRPL